MTILLILSMLVGGGADTLSSWQEQILGQLDDEELDVLGEEGLQQYMCLLEDLEVEHWAKSKSYQQEVTAHGAACLSMREGYRHKTRERIAANQVYLGDPWHTTVRWKATWGGGNGDDDRRVARGGSWHAALTADKDAGEEWGQGALMGCVQWTKDADCKVVAGDYRVRLGTGLLLNQFFSMGKSLMQTTFFSTQNQLTGHSSTDEYRHMRGGAVEWRWGPVKVMAFVSARRADGRITDDTIRTIYTDGYHRTQAEADHARRVWMAEGGGRVAWRGRWGEAGANVRTLWMDRPWWRSVQTYNERWFRGRSLTSFSADWNAQRWGWKTRGEVAVDQGGGMAAIAAVGHGLGEDWEAMLLGRWYGDSYRQSDGGSVAETSAMQGERGVTAAVSGVPWRYWRVEATVDWWRFTKPQYHIPRPCDGWDMGLKAAYEPKGWSLSAQYRCKIKSKGNSATPQDGEDLTRYVLHSLQATATWQVHPTLRVKAYWRSRVYSQREPGGYSGSWLASGEAAWSRKGMLIEGQATYFDAPDYETRLYLSERSLRYGFTIPMLEGEGLRLTATGRLRLWDQVTLEAKYAFTQYRDAARIGSGLQEIAGNRRHDVWLQLTWRL